VYSDCRLAVPDQVSTRHLVRPPFRRTREEHLEAWSHLPELAEGQRLDAHYHRKPLLPCELLLRFLHRAPVPGVFIPLRGASHPPPQRRPVAGVWAVLNRRRSHYGELKHGLAPIRLCGLEMRPNVCHVFNPL
jgi:hypothetical protein